MTQQKKPTRTALLDDLKDTSASDLAKGVAQKEGHPSNGSTLTPRYSNRNLTCYSILESELHQIGLANIGVTAFFSLGSAFFAFGLDLFKDTLLAGSVPDNVREIVSLAKPVCLVVGVALWIIAGICVKWRNGMIEIIKKESRDHSTK